MATPKTDGHQVGRIKAAPVPILMYHDFESAPRERKYKHFYVLARDFEWQMHGLKKAGYTPITFSQLGSFSNGSDTWPEKPIILTFDDGYKNVLKLAHPVLSDLQFSYTVFVVTGKMGGTNDWVLSEGYETSPLMDWDDVESIKSSGLADVQAHTVSHRRLGDLTASEMSDELGSSLETIKSRLGSSVDTICYPWGNYNDMVIDAAKAVGYTYGVTTNFGRVREHDDLLTLPRVSIHHIPPLSFDYGISSMNFWWKIRSRKDTRR